MLEQDNFSKYGEKKQNYLMLKAVCSNSPMKCSACTMNGEWQCPESKKQPPEVLQAIENVKNSIQ